jgi:membrane protease YdiL (CAAX protease family)
MNKIDMRRVGIYLLVAFGFSWSIALVIYWTGGIVNSRPLIDGSPLTWALLLLTLYMLGPAIGNVAARLLTREGRADLWLRPHFRKGWPYWLITWLLTPLMVIAGGVLYFFLFPEAFNMAALRGEGIPGLADAPAPAYLLILANVVSAVLVSPLLNALPILGEEFGWRAYLQPKLMPLGERKMYLLVGLIWGIWHWPVIWMGYNYPGYPFWGSLAMVWFTFVLGTFLGWATLRAGSVWPAVIGHGALNGMANIWLLFLAAQTNPLLGPSVVGLIGSIFFTAAALIILWKARS